MVIGLVAAGAGLSTTALFNDTETSADNQFTAGELDLKVDWEESYNGEHVETQELTNDPGSIFNFEDLKPGDHGEATVSLHLKDNPGWIWMNLNQTSNWDNACTEPERKAEGPCGSEGELDEELEFTIWSDDGDNKLQDDEKVIFEGTAEELEEKSTSEGILLDGNSSTEETEAFPGGETGYIGVKWKLPLDTGNRIQGDSVSYDVTFYTEQRRHNDNPENPWSDEPAQEPEKPVKEKIKMKGICTDSEDDLVKFKIKNNHDEKVDLSYNLESHSEKRKDISVEANSKEYVVMDAEGTATARLFYDGEKIDVAESSSDSCDLGEPNEGDSSPEDPGGEDPDSDDPEPGNGTATYTATQGSETVEIRPLEGNMTVQELYDFRLPADPYDNQADNEVLNGATYPEDGPYWGSAGTDHLQQPDTSTMFLYDGPNGLSFVVVHEGAGSDDGGSATWTISNLSESGQWVVKDDLYLDADGTKAGSNYDMWDVNSSTQTIDWTWGGGGEDGGAFQPLGENFSFTIDPAFNEESALYEEFYNGDVEDWQVLSGDMSDPNRTSLNLTDPVTVEAK